MDFKVALLLVRWPAFQRRTAGTADSWRRYFGDVQSDTMARWWAGQTDGQVTLHVQKLVDWFDLQATAAQLQSADSNGNLRQQFGRNQIASAAIQTLLASPTPERWHGFEACDGVVIVMDVTPPLGMSLDGGATTISVPLPIRLPITLTETYTMLPKPGIVVAFSDTHAFIAHEVGHMLGLNHSFGIREFRSSGVPGEYGDPWCIMSAESFGGHVAEFDPTIAGFGLGAHNKGPGLNGGTRAFRHWATTVNLSLQPGLNWSGTLMSLNSGPEAGVKVICINVGDNSYTVEFRSPADGCDRGLPCPMILVHHQAGSSADRTYPHVGGATLKYEIRAGGPGVIETEVGFRIHAGPMSQEGNQIRLQITAVAQPYAPWFPIDPSKKFSGQAPVAAVARRANHLDLFCVGENGVVRSAWWNVDTGWNSWFELGFNRTFANNAPITALARRPDHLDIFLTDKNGVTTSAWFHELTPQESAANVSPWHPWFTIGTDVHFRQDRPVAAVARMAEQIDLFRIGFDGAAYSTWWQPGGGWRPWFILHGETRFPQDGYITALARRPDHMDVFAVGPHNNVWSCWWHADAQGWRPWFPLFSQWNFRADQPVAAVARRPEHLDLFVMGYDGAVWSAWWDATAGWHGWFQIRPETRFDPQATVTAVARRPDHIDLYVKATDGSLWGAYWHEDGQNWRPWYPIHREVRSANRRAVTVLARHAEQLDLFEIDTHGSVVSTFWPGFAPDVPPPDVRHAIYQINNIGQLIWMRHEDAWEGGGNDSWSVKTLDAGWGRFLRLFAGGNGVLYAVEPNGDLYWYKHLGYVNGDSNALALRKVGNGWQNFKQIFTDRQGHVYAITTNGDLFWYNHIGWQNGSAVWADRTQVGNGWQNFVHVFAGGRGIIYAVQPNGELLWYRHKRPADGQFSWDGPNVVGSGWNKFQTIFSGPEGTIYGLQPDGNLLWYRHHGIDSGQFLWSGPKWSRSGLAGSLVV